MPKSESRIIGMPDENGGLPGGTGEWHIEPEVLRFEAAARAKVRQA